jgi:hypothetical protein
MQKGGQAPFRNGASPRETLRQAQHELIFNWQQSDGVRHLFRMLPSPYPLPQGARVNEPDPANGDRHRTSRRVVSGWDVGYTQTVTLACLVALIIVAPAVANAVQVLK